ncbi:hypothetical protein CCH79_00019405 [Gambusia affinis]|uniref:WH1 domain-containing protein n=1 Tax=Gambusia affinis TaxID=33528 RepID=A0A315W965_GAMAF|nr:hypothetical protein CCH79_00019405 [Gambusia affinis]
MQNPLMHAELNLTSDPCCLRLQPVLECAVQRGMVYNKVNPIFHHWRVEDQKFGLTFQSPADATSFEKGLQAVLDKLDRGSDSPSLSTPEEVDPEDSDQVYPTVTQCIYLTAAFKPKTHIYICPEPPPDLHEMVRSCLERLTVTVFSSRQWKTRTAVAVTMLGSPNSVLEGRPPACFSSLLGLTLLNQMGLLSRGRPRTRWRDDVSRLAWERLGIPPRSWWKWLGRGKSGPPF